MTRTSLALCVCQHDCQQFADAIPNEHLKKPPGRLTGDIPASLVRPHVNIYSIKYKGRTIAAVRAAARGGARYRKHHARSRAVKAFIERRVFLNGDRTVVFS
ncbi:hypothetical protein EMIT0111MI5_90250 [Burkholderia sp. IT-111MI5]